MTCEEGKSPMGSPIFKLLFQLMATSRSVDHVYEGCWLTLEWILIAKTDNCVNYHVNHLQWRDDFMIIFFHKSETNQDRFYKNLPWKIHANPMLP